MKARREACGVLLLAGMLYAAAPPGPPRDLTAEEQKHVAGLQADGNRHEQAGKFEEALRLAREQWAYRRERQGSRHWQATDARRAVEQWRILCRVPVKDRAEVVRAGKVNAEGGQLRGRGRYREAEAKCREALAIRQRVLGEQHPDTATSYNDVATCLDYQGQHADALPLYHKALAIRQKVLGERHPDTAASYNNVALCLDYQGKHADALPLLRQALAIFQKVLGEQHPHTAASYTCVAYCLDNQGKHVEALPLYHKALAIFQKVLGEQHPATATSYDNVASCLNRQGKYAEALPLHRQALAIFQMALGEQHPDTATSYNNVARCLDSQGRHADALPLCRQALAIRQKVLGEQHPHTAESYNNLALCLDNQGKPAEALPLYHQALAIRQNVLGEQHPATAASYQNVAACLDNQGKHAEALPLHRKALAIRQKVLGEQHPDTANTYNHLAFCLDSQGKHADALPLCRQALAIRQKVLGEQHPDTAESYNNLAFYLNNQGKHADALPLYRQALAIRQKVLGEQHPQTAASYHNVAGCLDSQGKHAEALPLYHKALAIRQKVLGERHPDTARSYTDVAYCLYQQGKHAEAAKQWEAALLGFEFGRLQANTSGFDRSLFRPYVLTPHAALAACLVRLGQPAKAWEYAEGNLGRGLLDDLSSSSAESQDTHGLARLRYLDGKLVPLLGLAKLSEEQSKDRDLLSKERDELLTELARRAARRTRDRVWPLERIQKQIPAHAALVYWLNVREEHLGCVVRREGPPAWVRLPGSGKGNAWTHHDVTLPSRVHQALMNPGSDGTSRRRLVESLRQQRLTPLEPHLRGVSHLLVAATHLMSAVPVEALTDRYTVSYVSSGTVFARQKEGHRPLRGTSLLALADPAFTRKPLPPAPSHGLLLAAVLPGGSAARAGLKPGDVLLEYGGKRLKGIDDLRKALSPEPVTALRWRDGEEGRVKLLAGKLGVNIARGGLAEALADWRKTGVSLVSRSEPLQPLPGTRLELHALTKLVPRHTALVGSEASEQRLEALAEAKALGSYRLLHLATHGEANAAHPADSALILAQDRIPHRSDEQVERVLAGKKPLDGRLTVDTILRQWKLDADLVVLSACDTGLGKETVGEGMLGFAQALLQAGARSVLLSRWKVDDAATALLMTRFYENVLGKRAGLKKPLPRAEALREAKQWLRALSYAEAQKRLGLLFDSVPAGDRSPIRKTTKVRKPTTKEDRPFEHPYFWAAFILVGDPD